MTATLETTFEQRVSEGLKSILFVEDEADDFVLAQYHLKKLKVTNPVCRVRTVDELMMFLRGVGIYSNREQFPLPAVIFLDLRLPGGGGLDAQAMLRTSLKFRSIPIILISSPENLAKLRAAVQLGANGYLLKPFKQADFCKLTLDLRLPLDFEL